MLLNVQGRPQAALTELRQLVVRRYMARADATRDIELLSACQMAIFGITLAAPGQTLAGPAYRVMAAVGLSEQGWAALFLLVALLISGGLALDTRWLRIVGMIGAAALFAFLGAMLWQGNPAGTGWGGNAVLCLFALRVLRRMHW